jgi:hypothetical protein
MQHLTKTATVESTTDKGQFVALAATWTLDRQNEGSSAERSARRSWRG